MTSQKTTTTKTLSHCIKSATLITRTTSFVSVKEIYMTRKLNKNINEKSNNTTKFNV